MDTFDVSSQTFMVTGGAGLIGEEICREIVEQGGEVYLVDLPESDGDELAAELGTTATFLPTNVTDLAEVNEAVSTIVEREGEIDTLVNCAYPRNDTYGSDFWDVSPESWNENVELHLGSYFTTCKIVARSMIETDTEGNIINFGSIYGVVAPDFSVYDQTDMTSPVEYSSIKAGVISLTQYLASYLGPYGIRVNAVSPGGVFDDQPRTFVEQYEERTPLGRMADPDDIVGPVLFLASDAARYVTGQNLLVDGGWTIS